MYAKSAVQFLGGTIPNSVEKQHYTVEGSLQRALSVQYTELSHELYPSCSLHPVSHYIPTVVCSCSLLSLNTSRTSMLQVEWVGAWVERIEDSTPFLSSSPTGSMSIYKMGILKLEFTIFPLSFFPLLLLISSFSFQYPPYIFFPLLLSISSFSFQYPPYILSSPPFNILLSFFPLLLSISSLHSFLSSFQYPPYILSSPPFNILLTSFPLLFLISSLHPFLLSFRNTPYVLLSCPFNILLTSFLHLL